MYHSLVRMHSLAQVHGAAINHIAQLSERMVHALHRRSQTTTGTGPTQHSKLDKPVAYCSKNLAKIDKEKFQV
jgi:hypothetical protein